MEKDMIINLENRKVNVKFEDKRVQLPQDVLEKIVENWKRKT